MAMLCSCNLAQLSALNGKYYKLKTKFLGDEYCLNGNVLDQTAPLQGAAYMDKCQDSPSQMWMFEKTDKRGWARLKTLSLGDSKCLVGKRFGNGPLNGAAYMTECDNTAAQHWAVFPMQGDKKYFTLTTPFPLKHGECLEGNKVAPSSTLGGAAFMSRCASFTGQQFYIEVVDEALAVQ